MTPFLAATPRAGKDQHTTVFTVTIHGATVSCHVSEAAFERWCTDLCCDRANVRRLARIAQEVVASAMPQAAVTPGERWIARVGVDSVALAIDDE